MISYLKNEKDNKITLWKYSHYIHNENPNSSSLENISEPKYELYNLVEDPQEKENLAYKDDIYTKQILDKMHTILIKEKENKLKFPTNSKTLDP